MYSWFKYQLEDFPLKKLSPCALPTFLVLSAHQGEDGICAMSYGVISKETGYSRRTTIIAVKVLVELNLIEKLVQEVPRGPLVVRIISCTSVGHGVHPVHYKPPSEAA